MVVCEMECLQNISQYLGISPGKLQLSENYVVSNEAFEGFSTIIQALVKNSRHLDMLGKDVETQALTRQWLEYISTCVKFADNPTNAKRVLKELNTTLEGTTYISGSRKTIADVALYYALHSVMRELSNHEKAQYLHLSRWFKYIQQEEKLRGKMEFLDFKLLHLYL